MKLPIVGQEAVIETATAVEFLGRVTGFASVNNTVGIVSTTDGLLVPPYIAVRTYHDNLLRNYALGRVRLVPVNYGPDSS